MKFLKKALPLCLLALALVICVTLVAPKAEAATVESGTCGTNLEWTLDDTGTLTISGTGAMDSWASGNLVYLSIPWYNNRASVKNIIVNYGVTSIGGGSFYDCTSLQSVTIPDSVTSIGNSAFRECDSLTSITIPDSVTSIGDWAFSSCSSLTGIWVDTENPKYCSDDHGVLFNKDMTTLIVAPGGIDSAHIIPDSVTSIGDTAFSYFSSLTSITIPDSVTSIGGAAFWCCSSLTSITIGDSVTSIGTWAFSDCSSLTEVTIPASVKAIGYAAFKDCSSLKTVYYGGNQTQWSSISIGSDNSSFTNATIHYNHIHDYTLIPPTIQTTPNCTQVGYIEYTCMYGETYRETLPALGHAAGADATVVAPTCTEQGYTESACSRCGVTSKTDYVPALGHDYSIVSGVVEPTCTEQGYTQTQCIRCEATGKSDFTEAAGHKVVVIALKDATCTEEGVSKVGTMCERCGMVFVQPTYTPALGHDYAGGTCSRCGGADPDYIPPQIPGDITGDSQTTNDDVLTLLWHVLFPEENPITVNVDFTDDGQVTNDDVLKLLWYVLFPEENPL